ncbi:hypothetical protein ACJX0J_021470 [Zea mays]
MNRYINLLHTRTNSEKMLLKRKRKEKKRGSRIFFPEMQATEGGGGGKEQWLRLFLLTEKLSDLGFSPILVFLQIFHNIIVSVVFQDIQIWMNIYYGRLYDYFKLSLVTNDKMFFIFIRKMNLD